MSDYLIFVLYCIIPIIIQCFALRKTIVTKNEHFWSLFKSIFWGMILSSISGLFLINTFDEDCSSFGGWGVFAYLFSCVIMILIGFIVMIIGFIIKSRLKKNNKNDIINSTKSSKIKTLFITNIIMICILLLTLIIPYQINLHNFKELENCSKEYLENYLDNVYGKENYEVIRFERDYSYNGIISQAFIGFEGTIHLDNMKNYFSVYVHGTNKNKLRIEDEIVNREKLNLSPLT